MGQNCLRLARLPAVAARSELGSLLPPKSSVLSLIFYVLSSAPVGKHLPCTATAVLEDEMQNCSLIRKSRKRGPDVWLLRWSDKSISGKRIYRKRAIGTVEEYPDSESARRAVASLIARINAANPRIGLCSTTLSQLSSHFERIELAPGNTWRSYSTKRCYAGYLKRWTFPNGESTNCETSRQLRSNPGFAGYRLRGAVAPRFAVSCPFCSTTPADMNCSTAIRFTWFAGRETQ